MSLPAIIDALVEAGATPQMIAAAVRAHCAASPARSKHADAQAKYKAKKAVTTSLLISDDQHDHQDQQQPLSPSPSFFPPDPLTNNPLPLSPTLTPFGKVGASDDFERFWTAYPSRTGNPKAPARKSWDKAVKAGADPVAIIAGAEAYALSRAREDPKFTAQAVTWLNNHRWNDDYTEAKHVKSNDLAAAVQRNIDRCDEIDRRSGRDFREDGRAEAERGSGSGGGLQEVLGREPSPSLLRLCR